MKRSRTLAVLGALGALALAGCGGSGSTDTGTSDDPTSEVIVESGTADTASPFRGGAVEPRTPAPAFNLTSSTGKRVQVADFRGKVVMVSFLYTRCPDICPVILQKLRMAQTELGADAKNTAIVVVSVDPEGDTPAAVNTYLQRRKLSQHVTWLVGDHPTLSKAWERWNISSRESTKDPALIEHSGVMWLLDAQGRRAIYYPLDAIDPANIAHDVRELAKGTD